MVTVVLAGVFALLVMSMGLFFAFLALAAVFAWVDNLGSSVATFGGPLLLFDAVLVWFVLRALVDICRREARFGIRWSRATRLQRFARSNGLHYIPEARDPVRIGMIFTAGSRRLVRDLIYSEDGVPFELGKFQYAGRSHERTVRRFGFVHLRMPRRLPHMVLVARRRLGPFHRSNLPWRIDRNQVLRLGGQFDEHFTLYCPAEYAEDARYVFTPKLMSVLLEKATSFDVEIVEDRLLLYRAKPLAMMSPATYDLLGELISSVGAHTSARAVLYTDPRAFQPRGIAPGGRRLRLRAPVLAIVISVLGIAYIAARIITALFGIGI